MKEILCICLAVAASLTAFAADPPDDAKAVQGNWKPAKGELAGRPMTDAVLQSISLKLDNGKIQIQININAAEQAGVRISSKLLGLAQIVRKPVPAK